MIVLVADNHLSSSKSSDQAFLQERKSPRQLPVRAEAKHWPYFHYFYLSFFFFLPFFGFFRSEKMLLVQLTILPLQFQGRGIFIVLEKKRITWCKNGAPDKQRHCYSPRRRSFWDKNCCQHSAESSCPQLQTTRWADFFLTSCRYFWVRAVGKSLPRFPCSVHFLHCCTSSGFGGPGGLCGFLCSISPCLFWLSTLGTHLWGRQLYYLGSGGDTE